MILLKNTAREKVITFPLVVDQVFQGVVNVLNPIHAWQLYVIEYSTLGGTCAYTSR